MERVIKSTFKSKPHYEMNTNNLRWSYLKLLRDYSTLKQCYDVDPYAEVYPFRENLYCILSETFSNNPDQTSYPWSFLIVGPQKAMLIDTAYGVGDLKGLCRELCGDKELIVVNTHSHLDHAYGNAQFDKVYVHEREAPRTRAINNPDIWNYLMDENGDTKYIEFDKNDIITWHSYEIIPFSDGHTWDLGEGYLIEAYGLPGHTPGQCAFYDHHNNDIFIGDINGIMGGHPEEPYNEFCTVEALRDGLKKLEPLFPEINGVFPGHRVLDYSAELLKNTLYACEEVLKNPMCYDSVIEQNFGNSTLVSYGKHILEGSALRYHQNDIYMDSAKAPENLK